MSGFVYLAHPIDQARGWGEGMVAGTKRALAAVGWGTYDPASAFSVGDEQPVSREIASVNDMALGRCRGMIAYLPPGVPTIGVPMEIERARHNDKPLLIVGGEGSWALAGWGPRSRRVQMLTTAALDWLIQQMQLEPETGPAPLPFAVVDKTGEDSLPFLPSAQYPDDAGLDLVVSQDWLMQPGANGDIPCSIAVELPEWTWGLIIGRSSTMRKRQLQVQTGVIDPGYRGELFVNVTNLSGGMMQIRRGERLAQLIVMSNQTRLFQPVWATRLSESDRGTAGFGSTGL